MTDQREAAPPPPSEPAIDLRALYVRFRRRLPVFLAVVAVVMMGVAAFTFTQRPGYTATASVLIEPRKASIIANPVQNDVSPESAAIDTEVQVLSSRAIAENVVERLKLDQDPAFSWALNNTKGGGVQGVIGAVKRAGRDGEAPMSERARQLEPIVDVVHASTQVRRTGLTYVIQVSYSAGDPQLAARMANAIAEQYLIDQTTAKVNATRSANEWLNSRIAAMQQQVQADAAAVQNYKIANNLMSASGATMAEQEVSTLNSQIAASQADLAEKAARLAAAEAQLRAGGGGGDVGAVLGSQVIRDLRAKRAEVSRRQAELETRYGPLHPEVRKVQRELADVDQNINEEISRVMSSLRAELQVSQQRAGSLASSRGRATGALQANNAAMVQLAELERRAQASQAIYEAFLNRSKETAAAEGIQQADARLATPAQAPTEPSSPNIQLNLSLGFVLAVLAGLGVVILIENLDAGLRTSTEVEALLNVPSVGAIPLIPKSEKAIDKASYVLEKPFSAFSEAFRNLKASLLFSRSDRPIRVISISSALPGEGKTLTTLSLGRLLASSGSKVVVMDGDLRRHALTNALGVQVQKGFAELLEGTATLDDVLFLDEASGAYMILCSDSEMPTTDVVGQARLGEVFEMLKERFDFVLIDTAPVLAVADTRVLAAASDVVLFLVKWAKTPRQAVAASLDMLLNAGAYLAGVCLTQVNLAHQSRLGYGDKLYYYQAYKKYYAN